MRPRLTPAIIAEAARDYGAGIEPALLRAVADVESTGSGFLPDDRPKILFEGHIFWQQLRRRGIDPRPVNRVVPSICYPRWTRRYYRGGQREYDRLAIALTYDREAALASASWGLFQLMGFNYAGTDFASVVALVEAHYQSERQHLRAIVRWMRGNGLLRKLAAQDWRGFARGYNGPGQVEVYAARLRAAYLKRKH
jgi:hypothetical protein